MNFKKVVISIVCLAFMGAFFYGQNVAAQQIHKNNSGSILFTSPKSGNWELWSVRPDGRELKQVTSSREEVHTPSISPDGKKLLYVNGKRQIRLMNIDGTGRKEVPLPKGIHALPVWMPDGNGFAFVRYKAVPTDEGEIWTVRLKDAEWQDTEQLSINPPMRIDPSYSPDGSKLACAELIRHDILGVIEEIGILDPEQKTFTALTSDGVESFEPAWSPVGDQIVYTSNKGGNFDLWLLSVADGRSRQLTRHAAYDGEAAWSPDGVEIVFVSTRSGSRELWAISAEGERLRQVTDMKNVCRAPSWIK